MSLFINDALAVETQTILGDQARAAGIANLLPFVVIFAIFYFLLIRPQMKKQKEHLAMLQTIQKGEQVVTSGGIIGTVVKIEDDIVHIEIATEVKIKLLKSAITDLLDRNKLDESTKNKVSSKKA